MSSGMEHWGMDYLTEQIKSCQKNIRDAQGIITDNASNLATYQEELKRRCEELLVTAGVKQ